MPSIIRGVAKKDQIKPSHPYRLGERAESLASPGEVQARIVQQNDESAVIEMVCECGKRIFLTCRFDK